MSAASSSSSSSSSVDGNVLLLTSETLNSFLPLLSSLDPAKVDAATHQQALAWCSDNAIDPTFVTNITAIFAIEAIDSQYSGCPRLASDVRQIAGYCLKAYVIPRLNELAIDAGQFIVRSASECLMDTDQHIRGVASIILSEYSMIGLKTADVPDKSKLSAILQYVLQSTVSEFDEYLAMLQAGGGGQPSSLSSSSSSSTEVSSKRNHISGLLRTLNQICDDASDDDRLDDDHVTSIVTVVVKLLQSRALDNEIVGNCVGCLLNMSHLLAIPGHIFNSRINEVSVILYELASTTVGSPSVRLQIAKCYTAFASVSIEGILPVLEPICNVMSSCIPDAEDPQITIECCGFWKVLLGKASSANEELVSKGFTYENLATLLSSLLPRLLETLKLTDEIVQETRADIEDCSDKFVVREKGMTAKEFKELLDEVYEVQLAESPRRAAIDVLEKISYDFPRSDVTELLVKEVAYPILISLIQSAGDVWILECGIKGLSTLGRQLHILGTDTIEQLINHLSSYIMSTEVPEIRVSICTCLSRLSEHVMNEEVVALDASKLMMEKILGSIMFCFDDTSSRKFAWYEIYSMYNDAPSLHSYHEEMAPTIIGSLIAHYNTYPDDLKCTLMDTLGVLAELDLAAFSDSDIATSSIELLARIVCDGDVDCAVVDASNCLELSNLYNSNYLLDKAFESLPFVIEACAEMCAPYVAQLMSRCAKIISQILGIHRLDDHDELDKPDVYIATHALDTIATLFSIFKDQLSGSFSDPSICNPVIEGVVEILSRQNVTLRPLERAAIGLLSEVFSHVPELIASVEQLYGNILQFLFLQLEHLPSLYEENSNLEDFETEERISGNSIWCAITILKSFVDGRLPSFFNEANQQKLFHSMFVLITKIHEDGTEVLDVMHANIVEYIGVYSDAFPAIMTAYMDENMFSMYCMSLYKLIRKSRDSRAQGFEDEDLVSEKALVGLFKVVQGKASSGEFFKDKDARDSLMLALTSKSDVTDFEDLRQIGVETLPILLSTPFFADRTAREINLLKKYYGLN